MARPSGLRDWRRRLLRWMLRPAASATGDAGKARLLLRRIREPGVGAVGVDGLEALRRHLEPGERRLRLEAGTHLPHQILDEPRPRVGALRDVLLVGPLEHRVEVARGARFHEGDEVLDPEELREPDLHPDDAALVVRRALADRLATRAEAGDRDLHTDPQVRLLPGGTHRPDAGAERACIVDEPRGARHGGALLDEVRKTHRDVSGGGIVIAPELAAQLAELADVDLAPVPVEQLDEAAHVRALALVRQRHAHVDFGDGVLDALLPIADADRIAQPGDPGPLQIELARVLLAVHVAEGDDIRQWSLRLQRTSNSPRTITVAEPPT